MFKNLLSWLTGSVNVEKWLYIIMMFGFILGVVLGIQKLFDWATHGQYKGEANGN